MFHFPFSAMKTNIVLRYKNVGTKSIQIKLAETVGLMKLSNRSFLFKKRIKLVV